MELRKLPYQEPWQLLKRWPAQKPLCFVGGTSGLAILAVEFYEVSFTSFVQQPVPNHVHPDQRSLPFVGGYLGVLSYDQFDRAEHVDQPSPSRIFRVNKALVFSQNARLLYEVSVQSHARDQSISPLYFLTEDEYEYVLKERESSLSQQEISTGFSLAATTSDAEYLRQCRQAIEYIEQGRFYQINLLRYFKIAEPYERAKLIPRFKKYAGPYASWFDVPGLTIASFSPEAFLSLRPSPNGLVAITKPIKGTRARVEEAFLDEQIKAELAHAVKDRAELNMIIDLLRNDLNTISVGGSVRVTNRGEVVSFPSVHHLVAEIKAILRPGLTIGDVLRGVCPGGSISGCPKREVMKGIAEAEQRRRGYFMGNSFYWDDRGRMDSSILIRTLVNKGAGLEYAAGSGIVVRSVPQLELQEIYAKCRVVSE